MTLYCNDLLNEFSSRGFSGFETYGEQMVVLSVPNERNIAETIPVMVEFQEEMLSANAIVAEVLEESYLPAVRSCNALNADTRWYKHFVQQTPEGNFQVCVVADWMTRELPASVCFQVLMDFCQYVYRVRDRLMAC